MSVIAVIVGTISGTILIWFLWMYNKHSKEYDKRRESDKITRD